MPDSPLIAGLFPSLRDTAVSRRLVLQGTGITALVGPAGGVQLQLH